MKRDYVPALHFDWLTPWYDRFMARLYPEARIKEDLIAQAHLQPEQRVLDLGCGTATLTLLIKKAQPTADVYGLDVDAGVLHIARRKARDAGTDISLHWGTATQLPYGDENFDHVFASLMLHHLDREDKQRALNEIFRVLKPGGQFHVTDFGKPTNLSGYLVSLMTRWFEEIDDPIRGLLPTLISEAGFRSVDETACYSTVSGTLRSYRASK